MLVTGYELRNLPRLEIVRLRSSGFCFVLPSTMSGCMLCFLVLVFKVLIAIQQFDSSILSGLSFQYFWKFHYRIATIHIVPLNRASQVPFNQKILWKAVTLLFFLVCLQVPLYGIMSSYSSDPLYLLDVCNSRL